MSWSAQFIADLAKPALAPMFRLDRILVGTASGQPWSISSHGTTPAIRRVRIEGQELNDYSCTSTWGRTLIEVVGTDLGDLGECVPRGTFLALYMGFGGYASWDFQRISWGQIRQVRRTSATTWTIELVDAPTGLRQRPTNDVTAIELFYDLDPDEYTTISSNYVTGDATLNVADTTGFLKPTGSGGAVLVTPSVGDPFFLAYTGTTGTTFTGVGSTDLMGTTIVDAASGDVVSRVAYLAAHPITIALTVLTSGYGGANGAYDILPTSWGLQVPTDYVDVSDALWWRDSVAVVSTGSYTWQVAVLESQPDGLAWLSNLLAAGGFFLAMRQGSLTVRAQQQAQAPIAVTWDEWNITDDDIVSVDEHEWWCSDSQEEFASVAAVMATGSTSVTTAAVYQRPAAVVTTYDVSAVCFTNGTAIRTEMTNRLTEARTVTPERITLTLRGWWWAQMTPGDLGRLTTTRVHSRLEGSGGVVERRIKITKVSPSWEAAPITQVRMLIYASRADTWA